MKAGARIWGLGGKGKSMRRLAMEVVRRGWVWDAL